MEEERERESGERGERGEREREREKEEREREWRGEGVEEVVEECPLFKLKPIDFEGRQSGGSVNRCPNESTVTSPSTTNAVDH